MANANTYYPWMSLLDKNMWGEPAEKKVEKNRWTDEARDKMLETILTKPLGNSHLKYFDKIPSSSNFSDKELAIFEKFGQADKFKFTDKEELFRLKMDFESVKKELDPRLNDSEKKLLTIVDVLQKEIDTTKKPEYAKALTSLQSCLLRYFSTRAGAKYPGIEWVDYGFGTDHKLGRKAVRDLSANLFNDAAVKNLMGKLEKAGAFKGEKINFYFWNTNLYNWSEMSYQSRPVVYYDWKMAAFKHNPLNMLDIINPEYRMRTGDLSPDSLFAKKTLPSDLVQNQYAVLGNFSINALPEGEVIPKANGKYDVCVNKVYYFVNDVFNFEGIAPLGPWRLSDFINGKRQNETSTTLLMNSDFSSFTRHGYGGEFPVLSLLHEAENFTPKCIPWKNRKAK